MNTREEENNIDTYFRENLSADHTSEMDADWQLLKQRLQPAKKKNRGIFPYLLSGIAALLLLFLSFLFFSQEGEKPDTKLSKANKIQPGMPASQEPNNQATPSTDKAVLADKQPNYVSIYHGVGKNQPPHQQDMYSGATPTPIQVVPEPAASGIQNQQTADQQAPNSSQTPANASIQETPVKPVQEADINADPAQKKPRISSRPLISLAFNMAPDVSGVNTLKNGKIGVTAGAGLSLNIAKAFSVSTGINYSQKVYSTPFSNYKPVSSYQFPVQPSNVDANCAVIDIPVGLNYTLLDKGKDRFSLGAGVSSYFMLNEKYNFSYQSAYARAPRRYRVDNENQHILGVANFSASYERKLPNGTRLGINPYVKLPLTDIGYGNVRLKSAGVALSLSVDLSKKQPKQ